MAGSVGLSTAIIQAQLRVPRFHGKGPFAQRPGSSLRAVRIWNKILDKRESLLTPPLEIVNSLQPLGAATKRIIIFLFLLGMPAMAQAPAFGHPGPEHKFMNFPSLGEWADDASSSGSCEPDRPACTHSCNHAGEGINGCRQTGVPCWGISAEKTERVGKEAVKTTTYYGSDNSSGYYCCKSIRVHDHESRVPCS